MVRQRRVSVLVLAIAGVNAAVANALPPSALESQAQVEFAKVGAAVRERLEREAAGDLIGAGIAAADANAHRYRFLEIQRELARLRPPSAAPISVAAPRDPFLPDASFLAPLATSGTRGVPLAAARPDSGPRIAYPAWDMYRPRESGNGAGRDGRESPQESRATPAASAMAAAKDMYTHGVARPASADWGSAPLGLSASATESPRAPFLVYRERLAGSDSHE
jgi:hypothetical protein